MKYKLVNFCELDKYAEQAYCSIHNVNSKLNLGDITKVNENEVADFNMIVGGSPCTDFSLAGKQKGAIWTCKNCFDENSNPYSYNPLTVHYSKRDKCPNCNSVNIDKTALSLLVEWLRILKKKMPNFGIYENVKNIVGKQFKETFKLFENELKEYGYKTYWKVLNAKDYGIPQNRERIYLILIKKELDNGKFEFPKPFDNGLRLKDFLEIDVDEKFYISQDKVDKILNQISVVVSVDGCSPTLNTMQGGDRQPKIFQPVAIASRGRYTANGSTKQHLEVNNSGYANALTGVQKDSMIVEPQILRSERTEYGKAIRKQYESKEIQEQRHNMTTLQPRNDGICGTLTTATKDNLLYEPKALCPQRQYDEDGIHSVKHSVSDITPTILSTQYKSGDNQCKIYHKSRVRKLTPMECFRLMGFDDAAFYKAKWYSKEEVENILSQNEDSDNSQPKIRFSKKHLKQFENEGRIERISNSRLYKIAGNSIVTDVLFYIYIELYRAMPYLFENVKLGSFFSGCGAFEYSLKRFYEYIGQQQCNIAAES